MKEANVSVIIPVHNGQQMLGQCLSSVLAQAYPRYEVIVVDNNSTDKTKEIIAGFQAKHKRLRYVFEPHKSRGAARNAGVKAARGEVIAMIDADCIAPDNWIGQLIEPMVSENEEAVLGFERDVIGNYWTRHLQKANWSIIKRNLQGNYVNHIDTKNFAVKAALMKQLQFDVRLGACEDFDLYLRMKGKAKIRFLPSVVVGHRHRSSFTKLVKMNFERAYWAAKIVGEQKQKHDLRRESMTESISLKNFFLFPLWMGLQFLKRPLGDSFFLLVSETSWRAGIIWGMLR